MAKRVYDTVLASECDGWVCGETLKKGSLPVDRLELDSFSEAVRELIERFFEAPAYLRLSLLTSSILLRVERRSLRLLSARVINGL